MCVMIRICEKKVMTIDTQKKGLLARVAYYYYENNLSQNEIATRLNIHRSTVSRMLQQARDEGIVQISINYISPEAYAMENHLRELFNLDNVTVVANHNLTGASKEKMFYEEAAYNIYRTIDYQKVVGITWGATLGKMVAQINRQKQTAATFVPLVGGPSHIKSDYHVNTLVYSLASKFSGESIFINASAVQESERIAKGILESNYFDALNQAWRQLDLAIISVGGPMGIGESQWQDMLSAEDKKLLKQKHAIGDSICRFFDASGFPIKTSLEKRTIGITLDQLKTVPESILIAKGAEKAYPMLAMLKRNYVKSVITDYDTALEILRAMNDPKLELFKKMN